MTEETIKLLSSFIMPVVLLVLGVWLKQIAAKYDKRASLHERIIEKRIAVYEGIGVGLNDIYVFLLQVGHWKQLTPEDVLKRKREIDKIMYVNKPYWSLTAFGAFEIFMLTAFETHTGEGEDAKFRIGTEKLKYSPLWQDTWQQHFTRHEDKLNRKEDIINSYQMLMKQFADDFGHYDAQ